MKFDFSPSLPKLSSPSGPYSLKKVFHKYGHPDENFTTVISDKKILTEIENIYQKFSYKKKFVHIGLGGSHLGPEMLIKALGNNSDVQFHFLNNSDPESIIPIIHRSPLKETLFFVVSKSGYTTETMAILSLVLEKLKAQGIPSSRWREFLVFCTDPKRGDLRKIAQDFSLMSLPIPYGVGGRFSVLTAVGLFPGRFAQICLTDLLQGAQKSLDLVDKKPFQHLLETLLHGHNTQGLSQTVLMPYYDRLKSFNQWFIQLWAESLGKKKKGLTPLGAIGAMDQHSQMQLFMDGPRDKFFIFIRVKEFTERAPLLPASDLPYSSMQWPQGSSLAKLIQCQLKGTLMAMGDRKLPYVVLNLDKLAEKELGELIMFFETLTALVGEGLNINPFNQPGVEEGKRYAFQLLEADDCY